MYTIDVMEEEHRNILLLVELIRKIDILLIEGNEVIVEDFEKIIDFVRNYSDKYHHGKEEDYLFCEMTSNLGKIGINLIERGMLVEHELLRSYILDLDIALVNYKKNPNIEFKLDIIEASAGYANMIKKHAEKENKVVYTYADKHLNEEIKNEIDKKVRFYEEDSQNIETRKYYLGILKELREKYNLK